MGDMVVLLLLKDDEEGWKSLLDLYQQSRACVQVFHILDTGFIAIPEFEFGLCP